MRYLGIDYGTKRIGLALSDENGKVAFPDVVLGNNKEVVTTIAQKIQQKNIKCVVLGESKDLKGEENTVMEKIRTFQKKLESLVDVEVVHEPEFFTSIQAERMSSDETSDASAAALILQSYLDKKEKDA